jgi:murein L,D-transpeptidase YcbB/YkuD
MNKLSALRVLSLGVIVLCCADGGPAMAAGVNSETSSSGSTTTYFPSNEPAATAPAAASTASDSNKAASKAPTDNAATETPAAPSTAAVTPPETKPETPTQAPETPSTAAVTPPSTTPPAPADAAKADTAPATTPTDATSAKPETQPAPPAAAAAAAAPPVPVNPVIEAVRKKLADKSFGGKGNIDADVAAAAEFYNSQKAPLWITDGTYNEKAKSVISDLRKADDWGLEASDFIVPALAHGANAEEQGSAEAQLTLSALKYARFARGGRLDPVSLSNILDMKPPVKNPKVVMKELAESSHPGPFLRGFNPHHEGFEKLRQALLKARGTAVTEEPVDPAELVKLPRGKLLRAGIRNEQVSLLRKRLKLPADNPADDDLYDDALVQAVRNYQRENGLRPDGLVGNRVRTSLNSAGKSKHIDPSRNIDRLIANMERWRWLPENLGSFYVMNNIPEYVSEIWQGKERVLSQKMIVGQPAWPTPILSSKMKYVIFHPSWGMPDGIKAKELMPRLRQASNSGFDFFDQLFGGGGGSGGARVIEAYKLQVYRNGQRIDPNSVNWNTADVRQYSFIQPPGADNPLGLVKFRFPNKHDVYMHDTPERGLFAQTTRDLSHGCMRVSEPRKTAEVILREDKGYSPEKVGELWNSGASVELSKEVPVYLVYFTARVEEDGHLATFSDIYGNDSRVMSALRGHPVRYNAPEAIDPTEADQPGASRDISDAGSDDLDDAPVRRGRNGRTTASRTKYKSPANTLQDALSNIFLN